MTTRRFPIVAGVVAGVVLLIVAVLWVLRIPLSQNLLHARLAALGLPVAGIEVTSVSPRRLTFKNLQSVDGVRLQRGEAEFGWSFLSKPALTKITLIGPEVQVRDSPGGSGWQMLSSVLNGASIDGAQDTGEGQTSLPEIQIRDASASFIARSGSIFAEVVIPSLTLVPEPDRNHAVDDIFQHAARLKADLTVKSLRAHGGDVVDAKLSVSGQIVHADGQLRYSPSACDRLSVMGLNKENVTVSGPLATCISAGEQGPAVVVDRNGNTSLDIVAAPESAKLNVQIAALPPVAVELDSGTFSLRLSRSRDGVIVENIALQEQNLHLPDAGISLTGIDVVVAPGTDGVAGGVSTFRLAVQSLRHLATTAIFRPLTLKGKGTWSSAEFAVDTGFRQIKGGLNGSIKLHRDGDTGEGQASFEITPLEFRPEGLGVVDVSPAIAHYVQNISGDIQASGRILFNDAWATPLQIAATAHNLRVAMKRDQSSSAEKYSLLDFGRSELELSLPPLSPQKGWASLNVVDGGMRFGETELDRLTGKVSLVSLWPPTCPRSGEPTTSLSARKTEQALAATIIACLYDAFAMDEAKSSMTVFHDAMAQLRDYMDAMQRVHSTN